MTLAELKLKDLTKIHSKYYYLKGKDENNNEIYNIFVARYINCTDMEFEPISLKEMLIELSDKVVFGNNFSEISNCLNLPYKMNQDSINLDKYGIHGFLG